jgi:hypothetical protein
MNLSHVIKMEGLRLLATAEDPDASRTTFIIIVGILMIRKKLQPHDNYNRFFLAKVFSCHNCRPATKRQM